MWTTTRSLAKRIKDSETVSAVKIAALEEQRRKEFEYLSSEVSLIKEKLRLLECKQLETEKICRESFSALLNQVNELQEIESMILSSKDDCIHVLQETREEITEMLAIIQGKEDIAAEHSKALNYSTQEIVRILSSLDEGNRLIIAKMLLRDIGD